MDEVMKDIEAMQEDCSILILVESITQALLPIALPATFIWHSWCRRGFDLYSLDIGTNNNIPAGTCSYHKPPYFSSSGCTLLPVSLWLVGKEIML
jgi:hypothetical protein